MDDNWDLHAVVRACYKATSKTPSPANLHNSFTFPILNKDNHLNNNTNNKIDSFVNLHAFSKSYFSPDSQIPPISPLNSPTSSLFASNEQSLVLPQQQQLKRPYSLIAATPTRDDTTASVNPAPPRSKKRKNLIKKVRHVAADALSSDTWAWRKYGQKPIKGSPYPRGYYKCSSSKGCPARKQVERNKAEPLMFIVTYTSEHNHPAPTQRNSLAGSTRPKPQTITDSNQQAPAYSSDQANSQEVLLAVAPQSQSTKNSESFEDLLQDHEDGEQAVMSNMAVNDYDDDDFFEGFYDFAAEAAEECFPERFPANFGVNWTATTARGGC